MLFSCFLDKRAIPGINFCLLLLFVLLSCGTAFSLEKNVTVAKSYDTPPPLQSKITRQNLAVPAKEEKAPLYTIKAGDTLFKILMREYGLTSRQAEKVIGKIRRENNISDFRRLRIGQKISISTINRKNSTGSLGLASKSELANSSTAKSIDSIPAPTQSFTLEKPEIPVLRDSDITANVKQMWGEIIPQQAPKNSPATSSGRVSISFDPVKYPTLTAMDGSRILVDVDGKIPPSIKSINSEADPDLRIIQESTANPQRFLASLVKAGKFYSVEENVVMQFGVDPRLTIHSDFKVERTADSLANQDIILLNAGKTASSPKLTEFLKKEGFAVYEPFAMIQPHIYTPRNRLIQVAPQAPLDIASSILKALSITAVENAQIHIAGVDNDGVSISITPDRYFSYKGKTYCISSPDRDSAAYNSLTPVLKANGINSIILNQEDTFREISERILTSVGLSGSYGFHSLWPQEDAGYSLQMSGIMVENAGEFGESLFLTDRDINRIIRDISVENGFIVQQ